jgi:hypothetical protein
MSIYTFFRADVAALDVAARIRTIDKLNARLAVFRVLKSAEVDIRHSTDSQRTDEYPTIRYGIEQARRAGLEKSDVLNSQWPHTIFDNDQATQECPKSERGSSFCLVFIAPHFLDSFGRGRVRCLDTSQDCRPFLYRNVRSVRSSQPGRCDERFLANADHKRTSG